MIQIVSTLFVARLNIKKGNDLFVPLFSLLFVLLYQNFFYNGLFDVVK